MGGYLDDTPDSAQPGGDSSVIPYWGEIDELFRHTHVVGGLGDGLDMSAKYKLRFFFDWMSDRCLWVANKATNEEFGEYAVDPRLPISNETLERCRALSRWHDDALNWDYPPDPGPWRQEECDRFNIAALELLERIRTELGNDFMVLDEHDPLKEDPELDRYLADPKGFMRDNR